MNKKKIILETYDEKIAERVAKIVGPHSASRKALDELNQRRLAGEDVRLFVNVKTQNVVVGPPVCQNE